MEVKEITSLEQQATELIQNISSIKQELSKKVAAREQFERETTKIVNNLTEVVEEMNNLKTIFATLGEAEMIKLFEKIDETNNQVANVIPQFDTKVAESINNFENLYQKMAQSNDVVDTALAKNNEQVASLLETVKQYDRSVSNHFEQINTIFQKQNTEVISINTRIQQHEQALAKYFDNFSVMFSNEVQKLENKLTQQETETAAKLNEISNQIKENEKQQQNVVSKLDSILGWLESNGQILIANSRTGLFGKKQ